MMHLTNFLILLACILDNPFDGFHMEEDLRSSSLKLDMGKHLQKAVSIPNALISSRVGCWEE
jgi:hypothetical protein